MNNITMIPGQWMWFCILFAIVLVTTFIMDAYSKRFVTYDASVRKFSILDLQFPSSAQDLVNIINGIYRLEVNLRRKVILALRANLLVDFIFMPAIYGCIFLVCMKVSSKSTAIGHPAFAWVAWLQGVALIFDSIENIYLLNKVHEKSEPSSPVVHQLYRFMVYIKWAIALFGGVCSLMVILYYFLSGKYNTGSLTYIGIVLAEIILFLVVKRVVESAQEKKLKSPSI